RLRPAAVLFPTLTGGRYVRTNNLRSRATRLSRLLFGWHAAATRAIQEEARGLGEQQQWRPPRPQGRGPHSGHLHEPASITLHQGDFGSAGVVVLKVFKTFSVDTPLRF